MAGPSLTQTGSTVGTFDYMAPERFLQHPVTPAVDVYALACVLYECITGRKPFAGDTLPALLYAHLEATPPPPSSLDRRVSGEPSTPCSNAAWPRIPRGAPRRPAP